MLTLLTMAALAPFSGAALAQRQCTAESEPNDTELTATETRGPICLSGDLLDGDQDLLIWEVPATDAATLWRFELEGVPGVLTALKVFEITSDPGVQPIAVSGAPILEVAQAPIERGPVSLDGVLLSVGQYLLGISRSDFQDGRPDTEARYQFSIEPSVEVLPRADLEPNDDDTSASLVAGSFAVSGDLQGSMDVYAWTVDAPGQRWDLELTLPLGISATLELQQVDGSAVARVNEVTSARLFDLMLDQGTYLIRISPAADQARPYLLRASPSGADGDPEPNDDTVAALPLLDGQPIRGRLGSSGDHDRFRLSVPPGDPELRDIRLKWRSGAERRLCLLDATDQPAICRSGNDGAVLTALRLTPGTHVFEVSGPADPSDPYLLRVDVVGPAPADFEAEPNDDLSSATILDPSVVMRGRGEPSDVDTYRMSVTGDPQLWQIDLTGQNIDSLAWVRPNGTVLERVSPGLDGSMATLSDLYLVPGEHWFSVRVDGPEYTIRATPLGPPDPDGEREPNSTSVLAEGYRIGQRKIGRLPTPSDVDAYRFTMAAPGHIRFTLAQPSDGAIDLRLSSGADIVAERRGPDAGSTIVWDLALLPGDHLLELRPATASQGRYELTSERLDPFRMAADQEPNDGAAWARPAPASLSWDGDAAWRGDQDWYELPDLVTAEPLRVEVSDAQASVRLQAGDGQIAMDREGDGVFVANDVPLGVPVDLVVSASGTYHVDVRGAGLRPSAEQRPLDLEVTWELPDQPIAAYWTEHQRLEGGLRLTNNGAEDVDVRLETTTSHYLWRASLDDEQVTVSAGESVVVPASVEVAADAWAGESVLASARATTADGRAASGSTELLATADGAPAEPHSGWPLPEDLLGGLDAAYVGFGATPGNDVDPSWEPALYDGSAPSGGGFAYQASELPVDLNVDLAGDTAVPVAGIILHPRARDSRLSDTPKDFELWLSSDGIDWRLALGDQLSPLDIEQAYVLDEPQDARYARLRILSRYGGGAGYVALGEWKVVLSPGVALSSTPLDLADPTLGGHLVTMRPFSGAQDLDTRVLDADLRRDAIRLDQGAGVDIVVGFGEDRAARIDRLEWVDPEGSDPATRLDEVDVWVSTQSPLGPWQRLGPWSLSRASDGSVVAFDFTAGTWARYVRLTGAAPADARELEVPATLRVLETPGDATYRSIVGEWGAGSSRGPFEQLAAIQSPLEQPGADAGDEPLNASVLAAGAEVTDRVQIGVDEDWYAIDVPPTLNGLEVTVSGRPTVGVALSLFDMAGEEQPLAFERQSDGSIRYEAQVEPGRSYRLRVRQPPFSAVFAFDTSGSIGPFLDVVLQGMRTFAAEVQPGREAVMIEPFEDQPLLRSWADDPYILQDAINNYSGASSSSGAEAGLLDAAQLLEEREGARAVLLVTDAVTSTYHLGDELWDELARARPIVFSVHIGAAESLAPTRALMQDWAASGGGYYTYPSTSGEMDRAFDRMATWLRRPAVYSLRYEALNLSPGSLSVVSPPERGIVALAPGVGVEILLDTSGSMLDRLGAKPRIAIAKDSLDRIVREALPEDVPVAIRVFGGNTKDKKKAKRQKCTTRLAVPLQPLKRESMLQQVRRLDARRQTATPIAAALAAVATDLSEVTGTRTVVLLTDGKETCHGDPAAEIEALRASGIDVTVSIVGFALEDEQLKAQMAGWAELGDGSYFDAASAEELAGALGAALGAPFRVYRPDGEVYEGGTVGGGPIELEPGTYRVEVLSDPPVVFDDVVIGGGALITLELPTAG